MNLEEFKAKKKKQKKREEESRLSSIQDKFNSGKSLTLSEFASLKGKEYTYTVPEMGNVSNGKWFKSGAFEDGYQFGDLTKTVLGTVGDASTNIVKGAGNLVEGVTDLGVYGAAGIADFLGADNFAEDARNLAKKNSVNDALGGFESYFDKNSVLDTKADSISQGLGYVGGILLGGKLGVLGGLGTAGTTALTTGLTFGSGMGGGMSEAYQSNATDEQALQYGLIKGAVESGSELLFGGLGKVVGAAGLSKGISSLDDTLATKLSSKVTNQIAKNFIEYGVKASAEGLEEVIAGIGTAFAKKVTYMSDEDIKQLLEDEQLLDQFIVGTVTSSIAQSGYIPAMRNGSLRESNKSGRDFITGYTKNEQQLHDAILKEKLDAVEGELTKQERAEIEERVKTDIKKGNIDIDTIEKVLGGDTYKGYESVLAEMNEFNTLNKTKSGELTGEQADRLAKLKENNEKYAYQERVDALKRHLSKEVYEKTQNDAYIVESYNENAKKRQALNLDMSKYDEEHQKAIKILTENVKLNNTKKTHDMVETLSNIAVDRKLTFKCADVETMNQLAQKDGVIRNAYINGDEITFNPSSKKAINSLTVHEVLHDIKKKNPKMYKKLEKALIDFASSKGIYESKMQSIKETYKKIKGKDIDDALANEELAALLAEDYIATNEEFVKNLSTKKPNIFRRIYEEIKHLCKLATSGSEIHRNLEKAKKLYDKAYKESANVNTTESVKTDVSNTSNAIESDINFSLSEDMSIEEKINSSMTMKEAKDMLQRAYNSGDIRGYRNADEWLNEMGAEDVAMTLESDYPLYKKYIESNEDILNEEYSIQDVLEAYLNGTLTGKVKESAIRLDTSKDTGFIDDRFYSPQDIKGGQDLYNIANQRVTNTNRAEVYKARADFIINAHNKGYIESLGLTREEVNKKLKTWANYTQKAMNLSNSLNEGVAIQNRWTGIENSTILNTISVSDKEMGNLVKSIEGHSNEWQRQYITSTMLALDTHINYKDLSFEFDDKGMSSNTALGEYNDRERKIRIRVAGQNTVAHEMGHYIDHSWGRDLGYTGSDGLTGRGVNLNKLNTEQKQFVKNFYNFLDDIENSSDIGSSYKMASNEVFARFVARFTEWTKNQATNNRYGYEAKWYQDNFNERQYREFVKILQEKAMLDTTIPSSKADTMYSLSEDSEGRTLTDGQREYFKDSKVRDENGALKVMYHGTERADFTVFDSSYSDDGISLFFTDNKLVAKGYSGTYDEYIPEKKYTAKELTDIIGDSYYFVDEEDGKYHIFHNRYGEYEKEYTTDTLEEMQEYVLEEYDSIDANNYKVYLNIKNPLVVDAKGRNWDELPLMQTENVDRYNYIYATSGMDGKYNVEWEDMLSKYADVESAEMSIDDIRTKFGQYVAEQIASGRRDIEPVTVDSKTKSLIPRNTRQYSYYAKSKGYDGVIFNDIYDIAIHAAGKEKYQSSSVVIAFDSNQIKSVGNINPTSDADIRYSLNNGETENGWRVYFDDILLKDTNPQEDIAPVRESIPYQNNKIGVLSEEDELDISITDKLAEIERIRDYEPIAEILNTVPDKKNENRIAAIIKANVLDKGLVFEELALKTKGKDGKYNRELEAKYDYIMYSPARAQEYMLSGAEGVKSLNDIIAEVENTDHKKDFYQYMYHKHNIDRMSLRDRYKDKNGNPMNNKPVFGDAVTSKMSKEIVDEYEKLYPEFKDFAQDVYDYMTHLRNLMVESGIITKQAAKLWSEMYPYYVPINRGIENGLKSDLDLVGIDTTKEDGTSVNAPIKKATGGSSNILPLFETMASRTMQTYKAIAKNNFGIELKNALGTVISDENAEVDDVIDSIDSQDSLLQEGKNGKNPTFTIFENGKRVTFEVTKDMYDALKPLSESSILNKPIPVFNQISSIRRGLITEFNPAFMLTNPIRDVQEILINSQHPLKTYKKLPEAFAQIKKKGYWYDEYIKNGGSQNTIFDNEKGTFKTSNKGIARMLEVPPLSTISKINQTIEMLPRLAEYIASREGGASVEVAMLDAARVTTNFKAGGNVTKFLNRNGCTFLNASVQGFMQQIRNFREAKANGIKGYMNLATKFAIAGLPVFLLNHLIWDDDEEYEELSDYIKQNYYVVWKDDNGQFVRVPKGRMLAVIQDGFAQMENLITGNDEVDLDSFLSLVANNVAPTNPADNNILAPINQVRKNETWYGEDLVSTRLQDLPNAEQYDESTDTLSKWLGEKLDISPVKINYLIDQYSGAIGDVFLPMMTPEAESGSDSFGEELIAPIRDKFTTDSTMNNQNVSDFYDMSDELTKNANSSKATDEDKLKSKYFNAMQSQVSELYKQKREIQNSKLSNSEKYNKVKEIQKDIVELTKEALKNYSNVSIDGNYAVVGGISFRYNNGEWTKISDSQSDTQAEAMSNYGISGSEYWSNKDEYSFAVKNPEKYELLNKNNVTYEEYSSNEDVKDAYNWAYNNPEKYAVSKVIADDVVKYKSYTSKLNNIKADKDKNGKTINGSRKEKVLDYIGELDIDNGARMILFKTEYPSDNTFNEDIVEYLNNRSDITYEQMKTILEELGFTVNGNNVSW